jgi:hypothetical protein
MSGGGNRSGEDSSNTDYAATLNQQFGPLKHHHHRFADDVFVDHDDVVKPALNERLGNFAGLLHCNSVGQRCYWALR